MAAILSQPQYVNCFHQFSLDALLHTNLPLLCLVRGYSMISYSQAWDQRISIIGCYYCCFIYNLKVWPLPHRACISAIYESWSMLYWLYWSIISSLFIVLLTQLQISKTSTWIWVTMIEIKIIDQKCKNNLYGLTGWKLCVGHIFSYNYLSAMHNNLFNTAMVKTLKWISPLCSGVGIYSTNPELVVIDVWCRHLAASALSSWPAADMPSSHQLVTGHCWNDIRPHYSTPADVRLPS